MSEEEKREYNHKRTIALRKRRLEEEVLLSTPAGRISNEALQRAQKIMLRNARKAESARIRYQRMTMEERQKYNRKRAQLKRDKDSMSRSLTIPLIHDERDEDELVDVEDNSELSSDYVNATSLDGSDNKMTVIRMAREESTVGGEEREEEGEGMIAGEEEIINDEMVLEEEVVTDTEEPHKNTETLIEEREEEEEEGQSLHEMQRVGGEDAPEMYQDDDGTYPITVQVYEEAMGRSDADVYEEGGRPLSRAEELKAKRAEKARQRYRNMPPEEKRRFNSRRAEELRRMRRRQGELLQLAECHVELDEETKRELLEIQRRRSLRAEQARRKYRQMSSEERRQYNAMRDAQRRQRKREIESALMEERDEKSGLFSPEGRSSDGGVYAYDNYSSELISRWEH